MKIKINVVAFIIGLLTTISVLAQDESVTKELTPQDSALVSPNNGYGDQVQANQPMPQDALQGQPQSIDPNQMPQSSPDYNNQVNPNQ